MHVLRRLALLGMLIGVGASNAYAGGREEAPAPEAALWRSYQEIRKVKDVEKNRRRRAIAAELGAIGSERALAHLMTIFLTDGAEEVRLTAMEGLCAKGDAEILKKVVDKARNDRGCLRLWIGTLLGRAESKEAGPWILGKSRLLGNARTNLCAVEALRALRVREAREPLLKLLTTCGKKKSKAALVYETLRALGAIGGEGVRAVLLDAARHEHPWRRLAAAETLLSLEDCDAACKAAVCKLLQDGDGVVREAAVQALGGLEDETYVPDLIPRLKDERLRVRPKAREALTKIAGLDLGIDPETWTSWWTWHQGGQAPAGDSISVTNTGAGRIFSNGVMFLLDTSKSMSWQAPKSTNRIDVARTRLLALIDQLDEGTLFNVIAVTGRSYPWIKAKGRGGGMVPATAENKAAARKWIEGLQCRVYTDTWGALEMAIEDYPAVDTIYYISDGAIRDGAIVSIEEIPPRLREINRFRKVVVHTRFLMWGSVLSWAVPYENADEQQAWLEGLAQQTGGTFEAQRQP